MGPIDALWQLLNLFGPAAGVGLLAAVLAKALWRRELAGVRFSRLAFWSCAAGALTTVAGLLVFGRDGRMATYGALTLASAIALWWAAFGPGRR